MKVSKGILVMVTEPERGQLRERADTEGLTVSGLLRQGVGLPVRERGGAREGAGRPIKKKPAARKRAAVKKV